MQVQFKQIALTPGRPLLLTDISWSEYEELREELSDRRGVRMNYSRGVLEIVVPLPEHEDAKIIISNLVGILLEELDIEFRNLASSTFKSDRMEQGLEADSCFYIENEAAVRGKNRIDLASDPPPDLALEIDITARTRLDNYRTLGVGELWRFDGRTLEINVLRDKQYQPVEESPHFPGFPLREVIPDYLQRSKSEGRNRTMKAFRAWIRTQIDAN